MIDDDGTLLRRYAEDRSEAAFAELVRRHLTVVYGSALRRLGGDSHRAQDVTQHVFVALARNAGVLSRHTALIGWLYTTTRNHALKAVDAERRRQACAAEIHAMTQLLSDSASDPSWNHLRPVIDEALDELGDIDRRAVLLRYFQNQPFAEIGRMLRLSEGAARRRVERALDKLRVRLSKRGVTSTNAALGLLLANQAFAAAPAGLAASITAAAFTTAPATGLASAVTLLLMSKVTAPVLSTLIAAGLTAWVWTSVMPRVSAEELTALRRENARLKQATAPNASAEATAAVADQFATQAVQIAQAMAQRPAATQAPTPINASAKAAEVTARGHSDHGRATAADAARTFAWACDICDPEALADLVYFDDNARAKAAAILATMPEAIRTQYPTPEKFYGMLLAASCLEAPPPGADLLERFGTQVELRPGRVASRRIGSTRNIHEYQQTGDGWKYVLPLGGVNGLPNILNSETLRRLAKSSSSHSP